MYRRIKWIRHSKTICVFTFPLFDDAPVLTKYNRPMRMDQAALTRIMAAISLVNVCCCSFPRWRMISLIDSAEKTLPPLRAIRNLSPRKEIETCFFLFVFVEIISFDVTFFLRNTFAKAFPSWNGIKLHVCFWVCSFLAFSKYLQALKKTFFRFVGCFGCLNHQWNIWGNPDTLHQRLCLPNFLY